MQKNGSRIQHKHFEKMYVPNFSFCRLSTCSKGGEIVILEWTRKVSRGLMPRLIKQRKHEALCSFNFNRNSILQSTPHSLHQPPQHSHNRNNETHNAISSDIPPPRLLFIADLPLSDPPMSSPKHPHNHPSTSNSATPHCIRSTTKSPYT